MNYITQLNAFDDWSMSNFPSTGQYALYFALLAINNKCGWKEWFAAPNSIIEARTGMTKQGLNKARTYLVENRLIEIETRSGNQATLYRIIPMGRIVDANVDANVSSSRIVDANGDAELTQMETILKQETKTETKNNSVPKSFSLFQSEIGIVSPLVSQMLQDDIKTYGDEWVVDAIKEAAKAGIRKYPYIRKILSNWESSGRGSSKTAREEKASRSMTLEEFQRIEQEKMERSRRERGISE